ncbi:MAG: type II restriction endonuclease, partial [Leptospira sp.]|nr:type II restriction endonuclease [Leptospira sp.]
MNPRQALNKAYLKNKINRLEIENFKENLITMLVRANEKESEEFHKNLVSDFLKDTYYKQTNFINTKGRNDLVIHNGLDSKSSVGIIIEAKKELNKTEMVTTKDLNAKAFQELILYYMRERIILKNIEIKHLIITNLYEWFIFDVKQIDRLFAQDTEFVNSFQEFELKRLADVTTDFFYKQIAAPQIQKLEDQIVFTYFDLKKEEKTLRNENKSDDVRLVSIYKLLSSEHLLKLPFVNDSNSLDKKFYNELLHIIGLTEVKEGSKKLIQRKKESDRNLGSIL